jgi:hypothetical protein
MNTANTVVQFIYGKAKELKLVFSRGILFLGDLFNEDGEYYSNNEFTAT